MAGFSKEQKQELGEIITEVMTPIVTEIVTEKTKVLLEVVELRIQAAIENLALQVGAGFNEVTGEFSKIEDRVEKTEGAISHHRLVVRAKA